MDTGTAPAAAGSPVGRLLKQWRATRGMSQLDLALRAGFSTRHLSFIETGRSQPSRHALLVLAETLDVPLRERNRLLEAGGFADVYRETALDAGEMAHVRGLLQFILDRHAPYAAVVLDRYSTCLMGNDASRRLIEAVVDPSLIVEHANFLRLAFHPLGARRFIVNWDEVAHHLLGRAERELASAIEDRQATALLDELRGHAGRPGGTGGSARSAGPRGPAPLAGDLLLPIHVRRDGLELRLFSTIMTLGTPRDVTLQELRIETFFPADAASEAAWRAIADRADRAPAS